MLNQEYVDQVESLISKRGEIKRRIDVKKEQLAAEERSLNDIDEQLRSIVVVLVYNFKRD